MNDPQCQAAQTPPATAAWRARRFLITRLAMVYVVLRGLFLRLCYRHLMRLTHYFGWHYAPVRGPYPDGTSQRWCRWCGLRGSVFNASKGPLKRSAGDSDR